MTNEIFPRVSTYFLIMRCCLILLFCSLIPLFAQEKDSVDYINPLIGASTSATAGKSAHGLGKTFPGSATPFGMVQLSPDTRTEGDNGPGYSWHHKSMEGFSFIHLSGIGWYGEFGNFLVTPTTGELHTSKGKEGEKGGYRSAYSHETEVARAGYYSVVLDDYNVKVELTSARRAGIMRMTFPENDCSRIQIDLARRIGGTSTEQYVRIVDDHTIEGYMKCPDSGGGWGNGGGKVNYTVYFYCQMSTPLKKAGFWSAKIPENANRKGGSAVNTPEYQQAIKEARIIRNEKEQQGKHLGFFNEFSTKKGAQVLLKCGISYISIEGAKANLHADIPDWDFDAVEQANRALWRTALNNVKVAGATDRDKTIFYTALYHTMIDPRSTSDVDNKYVGADHKIYTTDNFTYRTVFSGWDVFRSQFPLQTLINPELVNDEINSLISIAEKSGKKYFPRWEIMNSYSGCMIGNPAVSVLVDAYNKGIRGYDIKKAYEYTINSVEKFGNGELGYTPHSISHTLEYAYSDWCAGKLATLLDKPEDRDKYYAKSKNYARLWDPEIKWFRGKDKEGSWSKESNRLQQSLHCIESNPFQQGWFVPHDIPGLEKLMGKEQFDRDLDEFFDKVPDDFLWNDYYNHPNEPVHQVPFMFACSGRPWLTQKWTRRICEKAYGDDVLGLCGNEDVGQMSAWYVLAAMGFHPVNPGDNVYILTSPVFSKIQLQWDKKYYGGKKLTVIAHQNSKENIYIKSAKLNGKTLERAWVTHKELTDGGTLEFEMSSQPNKQWGAAEEQRPPSAY